MPLWPVFLFIFIIFIEPSLFVVYSFHSPQELLEFCGFIHLSAVSFVCFLFFVFRVLMSAVFSWEFFSLYLFILEGSDSLVSVSGLRPLPG